MSERFPITLAFYGQTNPLKRFAMIELQESHQSTRSLITSKRSMSPFNYEEGHSQPFSLNSTFARMYSDRNREISKSCPEIAERTLRRCSPLSASAYRFNQFHRLLDSYLPQHASPSILEIGCGSGEFCQTLLERGYHVFGVDSSSSAIKEAQNSLPRCEFAHGSLDQPFGELFSQQFDAIVTFHAIEQWNRPRSLIQNVVQTLTPGGLLIISARYQGKLKNLSRGFAATNSSTTETQRLETTMSATTLRGLLVANGLEIADYQDTRQLSSLWRSQCFAARKPL